ncbi:MAG: BtpA/SgcQ family protein [bacterium]
MLRSEFHNFFAHTKPVIGMVHLKPLPGSPRYSGNRDEVFQAALADARTLEENGIPAILVENFGDAPFYHSQVPAETIAAMSAVVQFLKIQCNIPIGVNVLRNDGYAAMAIACTTGAGFIRINVLSGSAVTDQGIISSDAHRIARLRRNLGADVKIFADIHVKHAMPLGNIPIKQAANELFERARADAVICTGAETGSSLNMNELARLREYLPERPFVAGSGVTAANVTSIFELADAAIVGTYFKVDGKVNNPVDPERVQRFVKKTNLLKF